MHTVLENEQVTQKRLSFDPPWILEKSIMKEV